MIYDKLASRIQNDINAGLRGTHANMSLTIEQIEDEIVATRLSIIKKYQLQGIPMPSDLLISINCIKIDCKDIERCPVCGPSMQGKAVMHFEIPQIITDFGIDGIAYVGSPDRQNPFLVYTSIPQWSMYHKYRKRGKNKPFIFIDTTPNESGFYDCFVFNAPLMKTITIVALFKDLRQVEEYGCCDDDNQTQFSFLDDEIQQTIVANKVKIFRGMNIPVLPNNQVYNKG